MIILCLALMVGFAVAIPWAVRNDRADLHLAHKPGSCRECDSYE